MTSPPAAETLTPGDLAVRLSVSDRTVRRLAEAYSEVYGELPRDRRQHRQFSLEAVLRLEEAAVLMQSAPGSSTIEILMALRDGLAPARQSHRPAATGPVTPDTLGPVMAELRALRAELAELRALVVTLQPVQAREPLPTSPPPEQSPEPHDQPQASTSTAVGLAEPVFDQPEAPVSVAPAPRPELRANQAELLERLRAGGQLVHRGQQLTELNVNGSRRGTVDDRTVMSLVNSRWLLEQDRNLHLTPAAVALLDTRARAMR